MPLGAARFGLLGGVADLGKLELIETVNITSSTASVDFTSLGNYNVHFLTVNDCKLDVDGRYLIAVYSNNGGSSWLTGSSYQMAYQFGSGDGVFGESKSTVFPQIPYLTTDGQSTNETSSSYMYFYNLLDSSKYSFTTGHTIGMDTGGDVRFFFGSSVYPTAETHNAIQLKMSTGTGITKGNFSLYGIRYS